MCNADAINFRVLFSEAYQAYKKEKVLEYTPPSCIFNFANSRLGILDPASREHLHLAFEVALAHDLLSTEAKDGSRFAQNVLDSIPCRHLVSDSGLFL